MKRTPCACTCRIIPAGSGKRLRSNASEPLQAPISHGLSTSIQPSGIFAACMRSRSEITSPGPSLTSRHLTSSSSDGGGTRAPPASATYRFERLRERADVEVLVEPRAGDAHLGAVDERREAARRMLAELAARAAARAGEREGGDALGVEAHAPAGRAGEERHGRVRARLGHLDLHDLAAQVDEVAALAAAEEVVVGAGLERVVDLLHVGRRDAARTETRTACGVCRTRTRRRAAGLVGARPRRCRRCFDDHLRQLVLLAARERAGSGSARPDPA